MNVYVIADLHFGDARLCGNFGKGGRPFSSVEEMNRAIVDRWNETVRDDDIIFVLGDVGRGKHVQAVRELRGRKRLIIGNNDNVTRAFEDLFEEIAVAKRLAGALLTHIPVHESQLRGGLVNVHGHLHSQAIPDPRYICVSAEQTNYRPRLLRELGVYAAQIDASEVPS